MNTSMQIRHITTRDGIHTTLALEVTFWGWVEKLAEVAGCSWRKWLVEELDRRPNGVSRASWVRCRVADRLNR